MRSAFVPGEIPGTNVNICTGWCYQLVQMFFPVSPLSLPFSFLFFSHIISSHPDSKSQILQVSNQDSVTKFTTRFQITISTHHITYYINLIHLIRFSQQHNNQDSQEHRNLQSQKHTRSSSLPRSLGPCLSARAEHAVGLCPAWEIEKGLVEKRKNEKEGRKRKKK
jgi:hypothetical protein